MLTLLNLQSKHVNKLFQRQSDKHEALTQYRVNSMSDYRVNTQGQRPVPPVRRLPS